MLRELLIEVAEADAEVLSDALLAGGALSVSLEDAQADTVNEQPLFGEPGGEPAHHAWQQSRLLVLIEGAVDTEQLLAEACRVAMMQVPAWNQRSVTETDWVRQTQAQFPPTRISQRLWIVPSWHAPPDPAALSIRLDPGAAFGTGTHPTTRLVLAWLDRQPLQGKRVLDYGCGSGILSIAAARLGAASVSGCDIDPQALSAARANAAANSVTADYTAPGQLAGGRFDIVLANILANPLKVLAPLLLARVAGGGALVLAGVLERQSDEMIDWYCKLDPDLRLVPAAHDDGWVVLVGWRAD